MPVSQQPVEGRVVTFGQMWAIVVHPAFRLGFLDAQSDRPFDHDRIASRITEETPEGALRRLRYREPIGLEVAVAQVRYEEGRFLQRHGLRCKAWGHPDYPPVCVRTFIREQAEARVRVLLA